MSESVLWLCADYAMKAPSGHRVRLYKRCQVDVFAEYLLPDGLVCRIAEFEDIHSQFPDTLVAPSLRLHSASMKVAIQRLDVI